LQPVKVDAGDPAWAAPFAGAVHQAIQLTMPLDGACDQRRHVRLDRHIGAHELGLRAELRRLYLPLRRPPTVVVPSRANSSAVRAPMPLVPPVITATLPSRIPIVVTFLRGS